MFPDIDDRLPAPGGQALLAGLARHLAAERERWLLWLPVGFGLGIGLYFSLESEPWLWLGPAIAVLSVALAALIWRNPQPLAAHALPPVLACGIIAAGFAAAQIETWRVAAPVIDHLLGAVTVVGPVTEIEALETGTRITLAPRSIDHLDPGQLPRLIRLHLRGPAPPIGIGDVVTARAMLMPPPGPALPGGFDFQRQAYFRGLGGVGYTLGVPSVAPGRVDGFGARLRVLRTAMAARIRAGLPGPSGAIAAALITGERGAIPAEVNQDYRNSGLAHLLVIAGLHMTLVTGFVFFATRAALALIPGIALGFPIKKWAAAAALLVGLIYLMLSGAAVPTQRAFVMVALGLMAIMIDRLHVSMLGVAWAAGLVLALDPAALTGVSFQMSFAAVIGLIAFYESFGPQLAAWRRDGGPLGHALLNLVGIALTTIIATLATAGFAIYHFNRFAMFSVLANLVAVPLAGFWVMPWALVACLAMPFGLEAWALRPMGWGLDLIAWVGHWTATLPGAIVTLPTMPDWGLYLAALGGLWLALWRTPWRRWGLVPIGLGAASLLTVTAPDILIAGDSRLVALRMGDGRYLLSSARADKIEAETWLRSAGGAASGLLPEPGQRSQDEDLRCDRLGCLWRHAGRRVAIVRDAAALIEDCRAADIVIALVPARYACRTTALVIDRTDLRHQGAAALWVGPVIRVESADGQRGDRPWVVRPWARPVNISAAAPPADPAP